MKRNMVPGSRRSHSRYTKGGEGLPVYGKVADAVKIISEYSILFVPGSRAKAGILEALGGGNPDE